MDSKSSGERDRLSFLFIDLHVPSRIAVCRERDVHISVSRRYRYRPRTEQDGFQLPWGASYVDCTIMGQGQNFEAPLP
jgi:hypothetical protein